MMHSKCVQSKSWESPINMRQGFLQVTGHLLVVSSYHGLLAVSFYLLVRAAVTCDL